MRRYIQDNIIIITLIITLLVGTILRLKGLTFQSYWIDELFSANTSDPSRDFWEMYDITMNDVHPPLYLSMLWVWYHIVGFTEYTGRLFSAIVGSLGILAVYILGKELFNKEVGLYAAIVASTNQFLIYYSQETRSNSLLFLLSIISYIYFLRILRDYTRKDFVLYLFFTIALLYTHYFGFFLVATQVFVLIYYFIIEKENRKLLFKLASITSFVFLVSIVPLLNQIISSAQIETIWMKEPTVWFALEYMREYVKSQYLISIFFLLIIFALIHLFKKPEQDTYKTASIVLLLWIIMGYLIPYIRSITAAPVLYPRSTIIMIPPIIIFLSYGIYLMKDITLKVVTVATITLFSIYYLHYANYYGKPIKEQFRELLLEVNKSRIKLPVYDILYGGDSYKIYAKMLNLNSKKILNSDSLNTQYANKTLPQCFFILDAHGEHISTNKIFQDKKITKVLEIKKRDARGVLYSYDTPLYVCSELFKQ